LPASDFDSLIEIGASTVLIWQPNQHDRTRERRALRLIGGAFIALAAAKTQAGKALENRVLLTEGRVTLIDAYLAGAILTGLALNAALGWWWADPLAGLVIVFYGLREGRHALRET
jgi:divalent metal cation (Fe/Co/Zn/Cd) transporter